MTTPRRGAYLWVTWLTPTLSGDAQCTWAPWFKAHFKFEKVERDGFNLAKWKSEHAEMVEARAAAMKADGWAVYTEDQNAFTLRGRVAAVGGKPDLVAVRGDEAKVIDCKGGKRRDSDVWQVLLYLLALPLTHAAVREKRLSGEVQYRDGSLSIGGPDDFGPEMRERIIAAINAAGGKVQPPRVPSPRECGFCEIGPSDCPDRIDQSVAEAAVEFF